MNFLSKQPIICQLIGRHIRSSSTVRVALFNKSSQFLKETNINKTAEEADNEPIKYFGSKAATWTAMQSSRNPRLNEDSLWYQPFVMSASLAIFLIYFCILREENDVDQKLSMSLYDRIEGLEESQLELSLKYNRDNGLSTVELEKRLEEIRTTGR